MKFMDHWIKLQSLYTPQKPVVVTKNAKDLLPILIDLGISEDEIAAVEQLEKLRWPVNIESSLPVVDSAFTPRKIKSVVDGIIPELSIMITKAVQTNTSAFVGNIMVAVGSSLVKGINSEIPVQADTNNLVIASTQGISFQTKTTKHSPAKLTFSLFDFREEKAESYSLQIIYFLGVSSFQRENGFMHDLQRGFQASPKFLRKVGDLM